MSQKAEKPVLSGQRIKTRKRGKRTFIKKDYYKKKHLISKYKHIYQINLKIPRKVFFRNK